MKETHNWYAVYTKPRWEKKVAELLTRKKIENYCPLNRVRKQWADRKKMVYEPLFTSYVFVRVTEQEQIQLRKTDGIINLVYWLGKPAIIKNEEIDIIKKFLSEHKHVSLEKTSVKVDDLVQVISGALMNYEGKVASVMTKTVKVVLPSLGYMMLAEVEKINVKLLGDNNQPEKTLVNNYDD
jgi:transcription antitermination factor NusG